MTDADREKWERVATRIGKWKLKCECDEFSDPDADVDGQRWCEACHFLALDPCCPVVPHDIPCPDPSDPAMFDAMVEWVVRRFQVTFGPLDETYSVEALLGAGSLFRTPPAVAKGRPRFARRGNKYSAIKTVCRASHRHDSKREAARVYHIEKEIRE
jgi:hypothetical protein